MRFSLITSIIVMFWVSAALWIWMKRNPWVLSSDTQVPAQIVWRCTTDGRIATYWKFNSMQIWEGADMDHLKLRLWTFSGDERFKKRWLAPVGFIDDDTLLCESYVAGTPADANKETLIFRRRFPEWWWGHFYRPEVWLFIALNVILLWRGARAFRARQRPKASDARTT